MSPRTITVTRDELLERREQILHHLGVDRRTFERRVAEGALVGDEWYAAQDLEEIAFLLDDERDA
ncbi:hypothetical protein IM660_17070 [Ruania alkalisoli]|uniref:Uncharacterized protein n=1 Tax=Ruania alkalisoli TaxID=2779775 RepID=A0A7M1SU47_9MICO|nr:hypothetical protein [Ruania alkalisoli]QOR70292.1 hypothetical protein IM660_17070 [Ruania alkalisoli]